MENSTNNYKEEDKLISIIMPVFNSEKYISRTIQSVLNQTHTNWELLLIDDCSTDNSLQIIKKFSKNDNRIIVISNKINRGPGEARNTGIKNAKSNYIAFLDSDDLWHKDKLKFQLDFLDKANLDFTFCSYQLLNEEGSLLNKKVVSKQKKISYVDVLKYNVIGTSTVLINFSRIGKIYMPNMRSRQDWAYWLQILKKVNGFFLDEILVDYTVRKNSVSSKKLAQIKYHWRIYRNIEKFSILKSLYFFLLNLFFHLRRNKVIDI